MSLYAVVDDEELDQVASLQGWTDFINWVEVLWKQDEKKYEELVHLRNHGFATKLKVLGEQIELAIASSNPDPDVESVALGIQDICLEYPNAEILIVTDGTSDEDDEEGDEDDE